MEVKGSTVPHTLHEKPAARNQRRLVRLVLVAQALNRALLRVDCRQARAAQHEVYDRLAPEAWNRRAADMLEREGQRLEGAGKSIGFGLEECRPVWVIWNEVDLIVGTHVPFLSQVGLTPRLSCGARAQPLTPPRASRAPPASAGS